MDKLAFELSELGDNRVGEAVLDEAEANRWITALCSRWKFETDGR